MGETCQEVDPTGGKGKDVDVVAPVSVWLWITIIILLVALLCVWFKHRNEMGEPFCCCGSDGNSMAGFEKV